MNKALIERDIRAYEMHMNGISVRAVGEEIGLAGARSAWLAIERGRQHVEENGIDIERRRIEIDQLFRNTLGALAEEVRRQCREGRVTEITYPDGKVERRVQRGVEGRTAEALARSADRWAQFLGLTDRAPEGPSATTFISLSAPADGAAFSAMCSAAVPEASGQVVDAAAINGPGEISAINAASGDADPPAPPQVPVARG
jgi:hypothetical protein